MRTVSGLNDRVMAHDTDVTGVPDVPIAASSVEFTAVGS